MIRKTISALFLAVFVAVVATSIAAPYLEGIACRSVHLQYMPGAGQVFYNEMRISESAEGSFFMVCGWDMGYFGMQELSNGNKLIIFSVWDSRQDDPNAVAEEERTKLVHRHENMRIGRFGGEGTGGQSFFDYDWQIGETYRFMVKSDVEGHRTIYSGYFFHPEQDEWLHLVSFSTITGGRHMRGFHTFVEDFRRNRISTTKVRKSYFQNAWLRAGQDEWRYVTRARFTADGNPVMNINAGTVGDNFFLATGGETENVDTPLWRHMSIPNDSARERPADLPL